MRLFFESIRKVSLPLKSELTVRKGFSISQRKMAIVTFVNADGARYYGELAPLPGLHRENLDDAMQAFHALLRDFGKTIDASPLLEMSAPWSQPFFSCIPKDFDQLPSVTTAVEHVLWSCFHRYYRSFSSACFEVAGFIPDLEKLSFDDQRNCKSIKVKIGRQSHDRELDLLMKLRAMLDPSTQLRLDANQNIDMNYYRAVLNASQMLNIEFIEEPFLDLKTKVGLDENLLIGLDESLYDEDPYTLDEGFILALKPSRLTFSKCIDWANKQPDRNRLVLSSSYESGLGTLYLFELALFLGIKRPLGVGTYLQYANDLLPWKLFSSSGSVAIDWSRFCFEDLECQVSQI